MMLLIPKYFRSDAIDNIGLFNSYFPIGEYAHIYDETRLLTHKKEKQSVFESVSYSTSMSLNSEYTLSLMDVLNPHIWGGDSTRRYEGYISPPL